MYEIYDYAEWRRYYLFCLRQYRQGNEGGSKRYFQEGLALIRRARNIGLAR